VIGAAGVAILAGILARPISAIGIEQGEAKVADPSNGPSDAP
jgi:hypothetical protein